LARRVHQADVRKLARGHLGVLDVAAITRSLESPSGDGVCGVGPAALFDRCRNLRSVPAIRLCSSAITNRSGQPRRSTICEEAPASRGFLYLVEPTARLR
jgi:hypothetical protein